MPFKKDELQAQITYRLIESLAVSERRYETLVENLQEIVFESDIKGNLKFLNSVWKSMLGYSIKESSGQSLYDFVFEDDRMSCVRLFDSLNERKPVNKKDTLRFLHKKGHLLWLVVSVTADSKGNVVGSLHDITELRETTVSKDYVDDIFKAMADTLIVTDGEGKITTVNQAALDMSEYKEDELIGKPIDILFKENDLFKGDRFEKLIQDGLIKNYDMIYNTKTGEKIPVHFTGSVMRRCQYKNRIEECPLYKKSKHHKCKSWGIVGTARDMRDTKKLVDNLKETVDKLTDFRKASIYMLEDLDRTGKGLIQAKGEIEVKAEKLKSSLAEKEILLREVHHRVKNNLQVVSSMLNMQSRIATDKAGKGVLMDAINRINTMALIHSHLYEGENLAKIDLKGFITSLVNKLIKSYTGYACAITPVISIDAVSFSIDSVIPCALIINELVTNSLKHAFKGRKEGRIEISVKRTGADKIILKVGDNGTGLPEGFNITDSTSLGLHLVRILAENQLRGKLEVSKEGGTYFSIKFTKESNNKSA